MYIIQMRSLLLLLLLTLPVLAQNYRGAIRGRITDSRSAVIQGASIKATYLETNESRSVATSPSGEFALTLLRPGSYRLEVESNGFDNYSAEVVVSVGQDIRHDVTLGVAVATQDPIQITDYGLLRQSSPALGAVVENRQVTGLPLDGRNFLELSLLVPGAAPPAQGSAASVRGDFAFNVNGAREDSNNFLLDGVYNVNPTLNSAGVVPPVDAIREFEVATSNYDASFGRSAGGQVSVAMKSGSNSFHGTVYEFLRNKSFDARNFFAPPNEPAPQYQRNQFGFSLGGRIIRDRSFFFADYEGTRLREGVTRVTNVPTLEERNGNFSQSLLPRPVIPQGQPGAGFPFPGDQLPFIDPIGQRIAALYPLPNRDTPFANFVSSPTRRDRNDLFDIRVDNQISRASQLTARYSFNDRDLYDPFTGPSFAQIPGFGVRVPRRGQNAMIGETHVFSPALINDARIAFSRTSSAVNQENQGNSINQQVGMPDLSSNPRDFGLSFITITGYSPIGDEYNNPQFNAINVFQLLDTATWSRGRHLLKFGLDIRKIQQNAFRDVQSRGFLTFSSFTLDAQGQPVPAITGNALADLLLGAPIFTGGARLDNPQHRRTESYNFFVNDGWQIRPNLSLSLGLRYEYNSPAVDVDDRASVYDVNTGNLVAIGTNGVPRGGYQPDRNNFAPRLGLTWTLTEKTVLRVGYGIYYDQSSLAAGEGLYFNAPYFNLNLYFPLPQLPLQLSDPFPANFPVAMPQSANAFQRDLRTSYVQHWNFGLQRQLGASRVVEVGYVGSKGTKLLAARDVNQPRPGPELPNPLIPYLRPDPRFEDITYQESSANSIYHSLQTRFQQRLAAGLSVLSSYTWSKSIDNASGIFTSAGDPNFPQDSLNLRAERGRSNFDVRHRFALSYAYDLPFGTGATSGLKKGLLAGWQTYGVITLQTGRPFTVALLPDIDNSNTGRSTLGFGANDRPNVIGPAMLGNPTPERWFNTEAFQFSAPFTFGNAGRNVLEGPGYQNVNFSLVKNTALRESLNLQIRTEFFNFFNHPNFDLPDNFLGSPSFGSIRSAQSPRRVQFGVKLLF
jgi:Carboxypeptidase regulatory-like domain/TonB dependent receptor